MFRRENGIEVVERGEGTVGERGTTGYMSLSVLSTDMIRLHDLKTCKLAPCLHQHFRQC